MKIEELLDLNPYGLNKKDLSRHIEQLKLHIGYVVINLASDDAKESIEVKAYNIKLLATSLELASGIFWRT